MTDREIKNLIINNAEKIARELNHRKDVEIRLSADGIKVVSIDKKVIS